MSNPIKNKCVVCTLKISQWGASKQDKSATARLAADENADQNRIRVIKKLISPSLLKTITNLTQTARKYRFDISMAWGDGGERLLSVKKLADYQTKMITLKDAIEVAVEALLAKYQQAQEQAKTDLGGTYKAADYPSVTELRRQYQFISRIAPVSDNGVADVRLEGYGKEDMEEIRKVMHETKNHQIQSAIDDCKARLRAYLGHFVERLQNDDARLRASLTDNLRDLLDLIDGFASLDTELQKQVVEARKLVAVDTDILRNNPAIRTNTKLEAQKILDVFK